jgi:enolase
MDNRIKAVKAREVLDSRGNPTVEVSLKTKSACARAMVPSGASTGIHEALEMRDKQKRYSGKGVLKAVNNVNHIIAKKLIGVDARNQRKIDNIMIELDGSMNKTELGANAILPVSMAACKAGAKCLELKLFEHIKKLSAAKKATLPIPQMNMLDGGAHVGAKDDIQEYMILPNGFKNFSDSLRAGTEVFHIVHKNIKKKYSYKAASNTAEGGFIAPMEGVEERIEFLQKCIDESGYGKKIALGLDSAASEFYNDKTKKYKIGSKSFNSLELLDFYKKLIKKYPIVSIEDGFSEDDWHAWAKFTKELGEKVQIVGDDLLVTSMRRIKLAVEKKACNSLLLKVNQIGTVTESIDAAKLSYKNKWSVVVSHRSGETEDSFIADLAAGIGASQSKFGAPARSERTAKYNQLLRIEENLGKAAIFQKL